MIKTYYLIYYQIVFPINIFKLNGKKHGQERYAKKLAFI